MQRHRSATLRYAVSSRSPPAHANLHKHFCQHFYVEFSSCELYLNYAAAISANFLHIYVILYKWFQKEIEDDLEIYISIYYQCAAIVLNTLYLFK